MRCLAALESGFPKQNVCRVASFWKRIQNPFCASLVASDGCCTLGLLGLGLHNSSLCPYPHVTFLSLFVSASSPFLSLVRHWPSYSRSILIQDDLISRYLPLWYLQRFFFQIKLHSDIADGHIFWVSQFNYSLERRIIGWI